MSTVLLEMKNICKRFPGVLALDHVNLDLRKGEVLALLGENGAGKSTLLKILSGIYTADEGEIILMGEPIRSNDIRTAQRLGIGFIHQELNYFPDLTVAENIFCGSMPLNRFRAVDWKKLNRDTVNELDRLGLKIPPQKKMRDLSVAEQQLVEIVKALSQNAMLLVMDEPTAALNNEETEKLLSLVREMTQTGTSVIFISHRLEEIFKVADRVNVLRDGKQVVVLDVKDASEEQLVQYMVGRDIKEMYPKSKTNIGEAVLEVKNLKTNEIKDASFVLHKGEVLGVFGLLGSGRTALAKTIFGAAKSYSGSIKIDGKEILVKNPQKAISNSIAYLPSERKLEGLVLIETVCENIMMTTLKKFFNGIKLDWKKGKLIANQWVEKLGIRTPGINTKVGNLSGGNQQKVVIAKWLQTNPKVLILNEPTRGIDVGAKVEMYKIIDELCQKGIAILLISSELP